MSPSPARPDPRPLAGRARCPRAALAGAIAVCLLLVLPGSASALEQKLLAEGPSTPVLLGSSVAIDGDTAVVGAYAEAGGGAAYVYTRSGDGWTQTARLVASDRTDLDVLGVSVAIDGDTIVAGASNAGATGGGAVYTFSRTGAPARTETAKLTASDAAGGDDLGTSVAIDGDTIVAGARFDDLGGSDQGSVYTFARTGAAARTQTAKLVASDGAAVDLLGESVAIDGDTIVAGALGDDLASLDQGSVYTFARTGAALRSQTAKLSASDGAATDLLGSSVAIHGETIVAGASRDDVTGADEGSLYTFTRTGAAARTQTAKLVASAGEAADHLGISVAIEGPTIVAGARGDDLLRGAAYAFASTGAAVRSETAKLVDADGAAGDEFGQSVAISNDAVIVGAWKDVVGAAVDHGSATIFFRTAVPPPPPPPPPPALLAPAKLEVLRARVLSTRRLDVLAPITARASGRVGVSLRAAGRTTSFTAPVDPARARVRIDRRIPASQARLRTGILTISYPGDADTQPQVVRLRAAAGKANLRAGRPRIADGRLTASGRISTAARGVARLQVLFEPAGQGTLALEYKIPIANGRYRLSRSLPASLLAQIAGRRGVVHSYTLFTGYRAARMRGEMASFQVLPAPG